jgi:hypothetical protein
MERRHAVALIVGLVLCLALLGRWALRPGEPGPAAADPQASEQVAADAPSPLTPADEAEVTSSVGSDITANKDFPGSGVFRGRLINAVTRQPVRDFDLEFQPARRTPNSPQPSLQSFRTKDGRFQARGIPADTWAVYATARGYQRFELPEVMVTSGKATQEVLIPMRPGYALHGRVFKEGTDEGIAKANITVREAHIGRYEGNFRARPSTTTQKDGAFALDGLPEGRAIVTVQAMNYGRKELEVAIGNKMAPLEIGLSAGGSITGYLAGSDGLTPIAGMISLVNLDENSGSTASTGAAGEFNFTQLTPGRYRLNGRSGALSGDREITLSSSENMEGVVLPLRGGNSIRGIVSGLRPEERPSAYVSSYREGDVGLSVESAVDASGAYTLSSVPPGRVLVSARARGRGQINKTVTMPADTDLTVNLEFQRGSRLSGRVTDDGKPVSSIMLSARVVTPAEKQDFFVFDTLTSGNGEYAIDGLPNGEYYFWLNSYRTPTVRVSGDTVFDIEMPSAQLTGRLVEAGGKVPVVGATVDVWASQPGASRLRLSATSDHFGQFEVRGLQPGDFVLSVYKPGYELYRGPLAYGSPISDLTINLRPSRGVEIKVLDASSGKAVNSVSAVEVINGENGVIMRLNLDQNGVGYVPSALAGSTLKFTALGYLPTEVTAWNGEGLEINMQRRPLP